MTFGEEIKEWDEGYRKRIYPKLTTSQKKARNFRFINGKAYDNGLIRSRNNHFRKRIDAYIIQLIKELKR